MFIFVEKMKRKMNQEVIDKIRKLRISKGLSQNDMANQLNITRTDYYNLESSNSYSWTKYMKEIMEILEASPKEFFKDIGGRVVQLNNCTFTDRAVGYVKTLHHDNSALYERLLAAKDEQIILLKNLLDKKS
jgi:transcriptional regulator with XRE-family HTH domain